DHRGVVALGVDAGVAAAFLVAGGNIEVFQPLIIAIQRSILLGADVLPLFEGAADLILVDQDRLHRKIRMELDLGQRSALGRIADTDEELAATLEQRKYLVLLDQLLADQLHRILGWVKGSYIKQWDAELYRVGRRQLGRTHQLLFSY